MKEQLHIVLITVGLFAGGLLTGIWTQKTRPLPPPPAEVLGEFGPFAPRAMRTGSGGASFGPVAIARFAPGHAGAVVGVARDIAQLEPRIEQFQGALDSIEQRFRAKVGKLLRPEQQQKLAALESAPATRLPDDFPPPPLPPPDADAKYFVRFRAPFPPGGWLMMSMIIYQPALEHLTRELTLDPAQRSALQQLMVERRTELLALIDKDHPPTLDLEGAAP